MISMEVDHSVVEVVPASPAPSNKNEDDEDESRLSSPESCPSPEIRVTDSPDPHHYGSPVHSPPATPRTCSSRGSNHSPTSSIALSPHSTCTTTNSPLSSPSTFNSSTGLPLLFQPFLSVGRNHTINASHNPFLPPQLQNHANFLNPLQRVLPFSIDNILRPTFGGNKPPSSKLFSPSSGYPLSPKSSSESSSPSSNLFVNSSLSNLRNIVAASQIQSQSNNSLRGVKKEPSSSPPSTTSNVNNNNIVNQPVDLSSKTSSSSSGSATGSSNNSNDSDDTKDGKKDDDVPPGMVKGPNGQLWPAWVFCTRYSDRPSSGPRARKIKKIKSPSSSSPSSTVGLTPQQIADEKRPRTAFSSEQLARLRKEFEENRYLNEDRRRALATELGLNETQIKIWFQNKRAKLKKTNGGKGDLAKMLAAQGLYNHATMAIDEDDYPPM